MVTRSAGCCVRQARVSRRQQGRSAQAPAQQRQERTSHGYRRQHLPHRCRRDSHLRRPRDAVRRQHPDDRHHPHGGWCHRSAHDHAHLRPAQPCTRWRRRGARLRRPPRHVLVVPTKEPAFGPALSFVRGLSRIRQSADARKRARHNPDDMNRVGFRVRLIVDAATFGPARRRRKMTHALRQLDDVETSAAPRERPPRRVGIGSLAVVVAVTVGVLLVWQGIHSAGNRGAIRQSSGGRIKLADVPTTTRLNSTARLLPAPQHVPASSAFGLLRRDHGHTVTWEPCRPIHYVIRTAEESALFDALLQQAIREVSDATGLKFVSDGTTGEQLLRDPGQRMPYQRQRYGDRWAPVLISWSDPAESPALAGTEAGFAAPVPWAPPGEPQRFVSGIVALSMPALDTLYARPHGATLVRDVMLHELGHLAGLDHVTDKSQLMYPTLTHPLPGYGAGDLAGLAAVGRGACFTDY